VRRPSSQALELRLEPGRASAIATSWRLRAKKRATRAGICPSLRGCARTP